MVNATPKPPFGKRRYPDDGGLKEPIHPFRKLVAEIVKRDFTR